jgi:nitrate/TMAO reductase-like tetraheme cytochrome c subunit
MQAACHSQPEAVATQSTLSRAELLDPTLCAGCHQSHYDDWRNSAHATAADDPVFVAMNKRAQRESNGSIGTFCVNCHAPLAVSDKLTTDGLNLDSVAAPYKGVTCYVCHNVAEVGALHNNGLTLAQDTTMRGQYADPVPNRAYASAYSELVDRDKSASSTLCGSCHDIVTPPGDHLETTFAEWQNSAFADAQLGQTCSQCHMDQNITLQPIADVADAPARRSHDHHFFGIDVPASPNAAVVQANTAGVQAFLDTSLQSAVCVKVADGNASLRVILDNVAAGHSFTSGASQDRRAWVEVIAYQNDQIIYQTGVATDGNQPIAAQDVDLWMLRSCAVDGNQTPTNLFWDAASHTTNTLPALATFDTSDPRFYQSHIVQSFPRDKAAVIAGIPDRVTLRVRITPIGADILDELIASQDLDPNFRTQMPTFDVGMTPLVEWTAATANGTYQEAGVTVSCFTNNSLNVASDKLDAPDNGACTP